jgi:aspartate kinase
MRVFKFGGASVKDAKAIQNLAAIVQLFLLDDIVIVISAMGKTTNALEAVAKAWYHDAYDKFELVASVRSFHAEICNELFKNDSHPIFELLNNTIAELEWSLEENNVAYNQYYDQCVSYGELLSTMIVSAYLNEQKIANKWCDAREMIKTDDTYREGNIDWKQTETLTKKIIEASLKEAKIIVTQGFIGCTQENYTTTLGREGSDYTAAIIAYCLNAQEVTIWKDVPGVLNADPKKFPNTEVIPELSYFDTIELSYYGATVIHPKTMKPLQNKNIPLYVKSFLNPQLRGTKVSANEHVHKKPSYISKENQALISIFPKDFSFIVEDNLRDIFNLLSNYRVKVNVMQNSALSFSVCIENYEDKLHQIIPELQKNYKVLFNENVQLLTIRYYTNDVIQQLTQNREVILEQKSRHTCQFVLK